jgi:hypothetical protein
MYVKLSRWTDILADRSEGVWHSVVFDFKSFGGSDCDVTSNWWLQYLGRGCDKLIRNMQGLT